MADEFAKPKAHDMSLTSCRFVQCFAPFELARQGHMVSLGRVKMNSLPLTTT